jgi:Phasin protein
MNDASSFVRNEAESVLPASLHEAQERQTAIMTRANEIMANAAKTIWNSQAELFQTEAEGGAQSFAPLKSADPGETLASFYKHWRENSEKMISHMRTVHDVTRQSGWQLVALYADVFRPASRS